jgi:membrane protease YdiL (CAAX protease family)
MNRIKNFASNTPVGFSIFIVLAFIALIIFSAVFTNRYTAESEGWYIASTAARLVSTAIFVALAAGLGWLKSAGFTHPGRWFIWILAPVLLAYGLIISSYALTGKVTLNIPGSAIISSTGLFFLAHSLLEETAFRGLLLPAFLKKYGRTLTSVLSSVIVSSLFFASIHFTNVLGGNPFPVVLLQAAGAFFLGVLLGGLVVSGRSIYPAVLLHGLWNIAAYLSLNANSSAAADPSAWLLQTLLMVPLAFIGIYLAWSATRQSSYQSPVNQPDLARN